MTLTRWIAGISLAGLLFGQSAGVALGCAGASTVAECGCGPSETERAGSALDDPCCCGCEAEVPRAPDRTQKEPIRSAAENPPPTLAPLAADTLAPPASGGDHRLLALASSPTPPLFLLHRAFRN